MSRSQSSSAMALSCRRSGRASTGPARRGGLEAPDGAAGAFDAGQRDGMSRFQVRKQGRHLLTARLPAEGAEDEAPEELAGKLAWIEEPRVSLAAEALRGKLRGGVGQGFL